jgi:lipoate-protein ligase A
MNLRLIEEDGVGASFGLAADESLAHRVGDGSSPPTLRLYTYLSSAALVGRFQSVENEIHLDFCRDNGIAVNRRPTGGGAILMGEEQLGIALTLPGRSGEGYSKARELMELFSSGLVNALAAMGVQASFRRKNDLEVSGRKIAGLGMYRDISGGLLFHASLLLDMDIGLMLSVLNTPFEKISDKEIRHVGERLTTLRREAGSGLSLDEVRPEAAASYGRLLGADVFPGDFTPEERRAIGHLERSKYRTDEWVYQSVPVPDTVGTSRVKTPAGMLEFTVCMAGEMIKSAHVRGDFFASEQSLADLEGSLRWHSSARRQLEETLRAFYAGHGDDFGGVGMEFIIAGLGQAVHRSLLKAAGSASDPYGCFVKAGEAHAPA